MSKTTWYRDPKFIRAKRNKSWTRQEADKIYALRMKGIPVKQIIKQLHSTVDEIQVHNVTRMMRKKYEGRCFQCGEKLTKLEAKSRKLFKRCASCVEQNFLYKKDIRSNNIAKGHCGICGRAKRLNGSTACYRCTSTTYRHRVTEGICGRCGKKPIDHKNSSALCVTCLKINRIKSKSYKKE